MQTSGKARQPGGRAWIGGLVAGISRARPDDEARAGEDASAGKAWAGKAFNQKDGKVCTAGTRLAASTITTGGCVIGGADAVI